jgi:extracellular factor (EF) 3-hydroxypalmitic acid methyl ester biosynthesis protein
MGAQVTINPYAISFGLRDSLQPLASSVAIHDASSALRKTIPSLGKTMNQLLSVVIEEELPDSTPSPTSAVLPMKRPVRSYADLEGGHGREVFFRPQRYQRNDLGPVRPVVRIMLDRGSAEGENSKGTSSRCLPLDCALHDVSQNGVAFEWPRDIPLEVGVVLSELAVRFDEHEAYRGEARVSSVRECANTLIVGASFTDSLMNVEDVLHLRDVKLWTVHGSNGLGLALPEQVWRVAGHDRFKALVAELRLFLEDAARRLTELEASLPWHVTHGPSTPARDALVERLRLEFAPEVVRYSDAIDAAFRGATPAETTALKEYSLRHLHDFLMTCPWMRRALHKPLGYPGDYEVMKYVYDLNFEGANLFAKSLSMAFLETKAARAVRARKNLIKEELSARIDAHGSNNGPLRILSIASGPAQEIYELLSERTTIPTPIEIVLFDQDRGALSYAFSRLKRLVDSKWSGVVQIVYLYDSIKRLLRDKNIFSNLDRSDVLICCGLFDYLQLPTAVSLCRKFYHSLNDGGTAYIGNMVPTNPSRWFMELHLDWFLIYRTREEMANFARHSAPDAQIAILEEETGVNPFVVLTRTK